MSQNCGRERGAVVAGCVEGAAPLVVGRSGTMVTVGSPVPAEQAAATRATAVRRVRRERMEALAYRRVDM
jgi:hypothetical protein